MDEWQNRIRSLTRNPAVVGCLIGGLVHTFYISKHVPTKYTLMIGMLLAIAPGSVLLIISNGGKGMDYWRYIAPGYLIGALSMMLVCFYDQWAQDPDIVVCSIAIFSIVWDAANVVVIQGVPSEYSGIASSVFVMFAQMGQ
jgi:hypothetical protein